MRIPLEDAPVHERARVSLVGVADDVLLFARRLADDPPFQAGGIPRAAAAPQPALPNFLDHFLGCISVTAFASAS